MSGLNQRFTKPSGFNRPREFESHILRQDNLLSESTHLSMTNVRPEYIIHKQKYTSDRVFLFVNENYYFSTIFLSSSMTAFSHAFIEYHLIKGVATIRNHFLCIETWYV